MTASNTSPETGLRTDLALISNWIAPNTRVLDLGCGDGALLAHLQSSRNVRGYGLEIDPDNVLTAVASGVNVLQLNMEAVLDQIEDNSFDYVVMRSANQEAQNPYRLVDEMLRIGRESIVTFPNFAYWRLRLYLTWNGMMPNSEALPNRWYNTPNIHLCTVRDFEALCAEKQRSEERRVGKEGRAARL